MAQFTKYLYLLDLAVICRCRNLTLTTGFLVSRTSDSLTPTPRFWVSENPTPALTLIVGVRHRYQHQFFWCDERPTPTLRPLFFCCRYSTLTPEVLVSGPILILTRSEIRVWLSLTSGILTIDKCSWIHRFNTIHSAVLIFKFLKYWFSLKLFLVRLLASLIPHSYSPFSSINSY